MTTDLRAPWFLTAFSTDASDAGYGVCSTRASKEELREEARYCELRGWTVCLEDAYADVEESVCAQDSNNAGDWVDDVEASIPVAPSALKGFRVLHLFSGFRRKGDLEWWIRLLAQSCDFVVEVYSIDLAVDPAMDLTKEEVVADLRAACSRGWFHALMGGPP